MRPRQPGEDAEAYIRRLEASNAELRNLRKYADKVSRAVTALSIDASVAFQAMAEKAGVRSHPSVTKTVELFAAIAHPQWSPDDQTFTGASFPTDWDIDDVPQWSGDADMTLNAGIEAATDYLEDMKFNAKRQEAEVIQNLIDGLQRPLGGIVDSILSERQRPPLDIPDDASRDQLVQALNEMSWCALDLAQDMHFAGHMLRRDLRAGAYRRICHALGELSSVHIRPQAPLNGVDVKFFGDEDTF